MFEMTDPQVMSLLSEQSQLNIISAFKPEFSQDGNMYCFTYGTLPNDCIQGFGETPHRAMVDFVNNFYTRKAGVTNNK